MGETWRDAWALVPAGKGSVASACCVFAERLTRAVYGDVVDTVDPALWRLFTTSRDGWGPVSAVVLAGLAADPIRTAVPADDRWYRVQAWHLAGDAARVSAGLLAHGPGHTFTIWRDPKGTGIGRVLDATVETGKRDVRMDDIGRWLGQFAELRAVALRP